MLERTTSNEHEGWRSRGSKQIVANNSRERNQTRRRWVERAVQQLTWSNTSCLCYDCKNESVNSNYCSINTIAHAQHWLSVNRCTNELSKTINHTTIVQQTRDSNFNLASTVHVQYSTWVGLPPPHITRWHDKMKPPICIITSQLYIYVQSQDLSCHCTYWQVSDRVVWCWVDYHTVNNTSIEIW